MIFFLYAFLFVCLFLFLSFASLPLLSSQNIVPVAHLFSLPLLTSVAAVLHPLSFNNNLLDTLRISPQTLISHFAIAFQKDNTQVF